MAHNDLENIENRTANNINISLDEAIVIRKSNRKAGNVARRPFSNISSRGDASNEYKFRNSKPKNEEKNYHKKKDSTSSHSSLCNINLQNNSFRYDSLFDRP